MYLCGTSSCLSRYTPNLKTSPLCHVPNTFASTFHPIADTQSRHIEYIFRFMYQKSIGAILSIDAKAQKICDSLTPPSNCPACSITEALSFQREARKTKDAKGKVSGIAYCGANYHLEDFVLYNSSEGPANIGQIVHIDFTAESPVLTLYKVGRTMDLAKIAPAPFYRDEVRPKSSISVLSAITLIAICCSVTFISLKKKSRFRWKN